MREGNTLPVIHIKYESHKFTIKDSYKLLPQKLATLCKSYGIADKGIFLHSFMNADRLGYVGPKPAREYYENMSDSQYDDIPQRITIKDMVIEYMMWDCKSLHIILTTFREKIHMSYHIDPLSNHSIAGVAYKIWLNMTNSMPEIARIANNTTLAKEIREAYYGGIAEVVVPTVGYDVSGNKVEVNANYYDVNSLYPSVMVDNPMPLGTVEEVQVGAKLSEMFGFCYAKVSVDETMKVPFLPLRGPDRVMAVTGN
ncbi:MAG: hypothetical protein JSS98_19775 [Bacteroidetes bacterium]|nr:hypothetical protein [Bacteroidota bacterium]